MFKFLSARSLLIFVLLLQGIGASHAADISACVANASQLRVALTHWLDSDSDDVTRIKLRQGTYAMGGQDLDYDTDDAGELRLLGGYSDAACTQRVINPLNTTIDGQSGTLEIGTQRPLYVNGITLANFNDPDAFQGIWFVGNYSSSEASFELRRVILRQNRNVEIQGYSTTTIDNTLVYGGVGEYGLWVIAGGDSVATIQNSTIAHNQGDGLKLYLIQGGRFSMLNSIVYGNALDLRRVFSADPDYDSESLPFLSHTHYATVHGLMQLDQVQSTFGNPMFVDAAAGNFRLVNGSQAINSGTNDVPLGLATVDIAGVSRIIGSKVDRGAYESSVDDLNNFTVTTLADNGNNTTPTVGSLRAAIKGANANSGASKISFQIGAGCPVIFSSLPALLPDITSDVTIDGYTQPGAAANSDPEGFNANICVYLVSTTLAHALRVSGGGRLTVRGIHFASYSDAAVKITSGSGHLVQGNRFEAGFLLNGNKVGVHVTGQAGRTFVGGADDPAAINLFGGNTSAAIFLDNAAGNSVLVNNRIGVGNGVTAGLGNGTGISILHSPNNALLYNQIDNNSGGGVTISGSAATGNKLQWNVIGAATSAGGNGLAGVLIGLSAANNVVGAAAASDGGGNTISNNNGPGVWITSTAGVGNRVTANSIFANSGLAIDLAGAGPLPNDASDGDAGANGLQNHPLITSAARSDDGLLQISASLDSTLFLGVLAYRVDFYYSPNCGAPNGPRGEAPVHLGSATLNTSLGFGTVGASFTGFSKSPLGYVTATATAADGSTSEIGTCVHEVPLAVDLFTDQFE